MLSRTANDLYWLARYMERAENMARIIGVGERMGKMPTPDGDQHRSEWHSAVAISGTQALFSERGRAPDARSVIDFMARDEQNPSSIFSCIRAARDNARSVRNAITTEMWECLNGTWLEFDEVWNDARKSGETGPFLEWVKDRSAVFRGSQFGTMLREEAFYFSRIGTYIERADNTARILDVKYHVLLPGDEEVGGGVDYYQWTTILRAVSALRSYHWLYRENPKPWRIAEFLILREEMPRSLIFCIKEVSDNLDALARQHGVRHECHRLVGKLFSQLRYSNAADIFQNGLHEFLTDFISENNRLGETIASDYLFYG